MRLAWLSDIHLNFVRDEISGEFEEAYFNCCQEIARSSADAILISGDIAEAPDLEEYLERFSQDAPKLPIYFVLGNHDFYRGSIIRQRSSIRSFCDQHPNFCYLTSQEKPIPLTSQTVMIGHDGLADGRLGDFEGSSVKIADYSYIEELTGITNAARLERMNALGDESAAHLRQMLEMVPAEVRTIIVVTHVPPFWAACLHRGAVSRPDWVPHFSCEAVGDVLIEASLNRPDQQIIAFCGHTHSPAKYQPKPNLNVFAAKAEYGSPQLQRVIEFD